MKINKIKRVMYYFSGSLFLLLAGCSFSNKTSLKLYNKASEKSYDLVVVPGVPLENGKWSDVMKARIYWSKYLFDKGIAKNIMYSGNAVYTPYVESEVMALYAEAIGIPKENIFTESKAEHSTENIYYSYKKSKKLNFNRIALASDPFQTKMLQRFTRLRVSKDVDLIPIVFDTLKSMEPAMKDPVIDPSTAFVTDFTSLPERKSFWNRLQGTMGKDLDKNAYQ
jgi:hypothetical protein